LSHKTPHRISVRQLIDVCLKRGDLGGGYVSRTRALDGIREHSRLQAERGDGYKKEVSASIRVNHLDIELEVYGRIDGLFESKEPLVVEEIKTCLGSAQEKVDHPADPQSRMHMAQLKCYGHMIAVDRKLETIILQLTYVTVSTQALAHTKKEYSANELSSFFDSLAIQYCSILADQINWDKTRNESITELPFPYQTFRENQRDLAETVYKIIKNEKILFARAPTGTGKTIATLFPAIKALGLGHTDKIFYLTAKTIGRTVALKAVHDLKTAGLKLKSVVLTAKQKICFISDDFCDTENCPYARGYYDKIQKAMPDIRMFNTFDREKIERLASKYEICPFELSLDVSMICDVIICDLNYCFDPRVYLKRYFDPSRQKFTFLIDEAHNLHDRLRSMYSAVLTRSDILTVQRLLRDENPGLSRILVNINRQFTRLTPSVTLNEIPDELLSELKTFAARADQWLNQNREENETRAIVLDFYFKANIFLTIATYWDTNYKFYLEDLNKTGHLNKNGQLNENAPSSKKDLVLKLYCLDPSPIFSDLIQRGRSSILFSATLTPIDYHREMLFNQDTHPYAIDLASPFSRDHLGLFLYPGVETRYTKRAGYYHKIARLISRIVQSRQGNYLIYFPSYAFLNDVFQFIEKDDLNTEVLIQSRHMSETQRQDFLDAFSKGDPVTGFVIMGGIFGEGIDLTGEQLIGAVIISPGIPQICLERDLIRNYYDEKDHSGFFKSYQMPGFNRVMQAAGRVIRTHEDKGIVILMDERFSRQDYRRLFPEEWTGAKVIEDSNHLTTELETFWQV